MSAATGPSRWLGGTWVHLLGAAVLDFIHLLGGLGLLVRDTFTHLFVGPLRGRPVSGIGFVRQSVRVGPRALGVVFLVNVFVGMILALIGGSILEDLGFVHYVGNLMSVGTVVELGPLLTGIIMTGFIGAALAAEIGTMVVREEITAIRTMALNPVRYVVAPRMLAVMLMVPCLTMLGNWLGILGGLFVAKGVLGVPAVTYFHQAWLQLTPEDVWRGLTKAVMFGFIIGSVGCWRGFQVEGGAEGVGRATTSAVVTAILLIIVTDAVLNYFLLFRL
jgi:phospholipid/cholesterol/gamma-HCH transport system permease protein